METAAVREIERQRTELEALSQRIWENPDLAFEERRTCRELAEYLRGQGFRVQFGSGILKTAVKAEWGTGSPSIGFLGELDALPGLKQSASARRDPDGENGNGHGCGHNLVAVGHAAAAAGLKRQMEKENLPGRIVYYGCPAEEAGTGKIHMAGAHFFDDIDCFIHFHPGQMNTVGISAISSMSAQFDFRGVSAHPSINPEDGRSALEGAELLNIGANYLRRRVPKDVSISYVITDGGDAPNIIPQKSSVLYDLRALKRSTVFDVYRKLVRVAEGAATMSGTSVKPRLLGCTYDLLNNSVLSDLVEQCFAKVPQEDYTAEETAFMQALNADQPQYTQSMRETLKNGTEGEIHTGMEPVHPNFGSTDVGDVSHIVPGVTFRTACYPLGVEGHTWKSTACSGHTVGTKGMIRAAKIMAEFALELLRDPKYLREAKEEFARATAGEKYQCSAAAPSEDI